MNGKNGLIKAVLSTLLLAVALCAPLVGCQAQTPPETFDRAKAAALTPERRSQVDVAFFNDFVARDMPGGMWESGASHPRGGRIHALAEEGFEVAWLAERLYNFHRFGYRDTPHAGYYWDRIKALADGGDASAQCFLAKSVWELREYGFFKPPKADMDKAYDYLEKAAAQGQAQCSGDWGNYRYENAPAKRAELNLDGAKKGCAECMVRVTGAYERGDDLPRDLSKAWCWILEAQRASDSVSYENRKRSLIGIIMSMKPNDTGRPEDLAQYRPGSNCTEPIAASASTIKSTKGE